MTPAEARQAWAQPYIDAATARVPYGSPAWLALPDGPDKVASCVRAAEAYLLEAEEGLERLRLEHLAAAQEAKQAEDAERAERAATHRQEWSRKSWRPHPATVRAERRGAA